MSLKQQERKMILMYLTILLIFFVFRYHVVYYFVAYGQKSVEEIKALASVKYQERREKIKHICDTNPQIFLPVHLDEKWKQALYFDYEHTLLYCGVSKVSSTTWNTNLMK